MKGQTLKKVVRSFVTSNPGRDPKVNWRLNETEQEQMNEMSWPLCINCGKENIRKESNTVVLCMFVFIPLTN